MLSLRERVGAWISGPPKRALPTPIDFGSRLSATFGPGIGAQPSHAALLRESLGVADMATRAIANRVGSLEPVVKVSKRDTAGTKVDEILDDHPLKVLLDRPHPDLSRLQLFRLTAQHILTVGEAYWLKVGSRLGVPIELHPMPPTNVWPIIRGGVVSQYGVRDGSGRDKFIRTGDIVRFYFPDPENIFGSEGYLGPAGITADSLKFAGQHLRHHYESDATPRTVIKSSDLATAFKPEEADRFNLAWRQRYASRSGSLSGVPAILPTGYDLIQLMIQSGADIVPLLDHWRDEQLMGFGVPRSILGQVVSGDRSSAETNQYVFDLHTVTPIAMMISDALTLQLAPDFDPSVFVGFDDFVSRDKNFELAREGSDLDRKVRSINQVREDREIDPVDWGDLPVGTFGEIPYTGEEPEPVGPDLASALDGADDDDADDDQEPRALGSHSPDAEWKRQMSREKKYVPPFTRAVSGIMKQQSAVAIARLRDQSEPRQRAISAGDLIFPKEWQTTFEKRVEPIRQRAYSAILKESLKSLGVAGSFTFTETMRDVLRKQGAHLVTNVYKTTIRRIAGALEVSAAKGEGIDATAKRIESVFDVRRSESLTIARTEMLRASQAAQIESYDIGEVDRVAWHTARDAKVRDTHAVMEGVTVERGQLFTLGDGEMARAPGIGATGDPLSAGNSINCRCFTVPVFDDEGGGEDG